MKKDAKHYKIISTSDWESGRNESNQANYIQKTYYARCGDDSLSITGMVIACDDSPDNYSLFAWEGLPSCTDLSPPDTEYKTQEEAKTAMDKFINETYRGV